MSADQAPVPDPDPRRLDDEQLMRHYVRHRDRGEIDRARPYWNRLVENAFDRILGMVGAWRWPGVGVAVRPDDVPDVTQDALLRLANDVIKNFRGTAIGQFRKATRTCVDYTCRDYARKRMTHEKHVKGNLEDEVPGEEGPVSRWERYLVREAERQAERREEELSAREAYERALRRVPSEDQRTVVRMTLAGYSTEEIAAQVGTSPDNVYQLRLRGQRKLKEVLDDGLA